MTVCRPNHATKQRAIAWWFGLLVALVINPMLADTIRLPESSDAWLEDTFFLDSHNGWCVGRQGVIWHTDDGGQHWQLQHAEPHIVLHCVYFLDGNTGWAVGGRVHPLTWQTSAVILRTTSGGRRWTPMEAIGLPELREVHFFNENEGIAAGLTSSLYTTGIVRTEDGGRSWIGVAGVPSGTWSAATFSSTTDGLLVGDMGAAWLVRGKLQMAQSLDPSLAHLRAMVFVSPNQPAWIVGDGGQLKRWSSSHGRWEEWEFHLPAAFRRTTLPASKTGSTDVDRLLRGSSATRLAPDYHTIAQIGRHLWIAGAPGSFVLHSSDNGNSWEVQFTGQTMPISDIHFVDEQHGWAVGALGTILATRNSGTTWEIQRRGGDRLALWGLHRSPTRTPMPLISYFAAQEGWLAGVTILGQTGMPRSTRAEAGIERRLQAAVGSIQGSVVTIAEQFPVIQSGERVCMTPTMENWRRRHGPSADQAWQSFLYWQLAQWQPDVVCFGGLETDPDDSFDHYLHRAFLMVMQQSSNSTSFPQQLRQWGLTPWRPTKLVQLTASRRRATGSIGITQLMPIVMQSVSDHVWPAQNYLTHGLSQLPERFGWRVVSLRDRPQQATHGLLDLSTKSRDRIWRSLPQITLDLKRINATAGAMREFHDILESPATFLSQADWEVRLQEKLRPLPQFHVGEAKYRFALAAAKAGHWQAARKTMSRFVTGHGRHALHEAALWWLIRYDRSAEIATMERSQMPVPNGVSKATFVSPTPTPTQTNSVLPLPDPPTSDPPTNKWWQPLVDLAPQSSADPTVALPAAARMRHGQPRDATELWNQVSGSAWLQWSRLAKGEIWLIKSRGNSPVPVALTRLTTRPHIDGKMDELLWNSTHPVKLQTSRFTQVSGNTVARFAYDREFLYLAIECEKIRNYRYPAMAPRAGRDQADPQLDHFTWQIDVDRDYSTAFNFTVDSRGWVSEGVTGSTAWDPTWYVAATETPRQWSAECAISWQALGVMPPTSEHPFAIKLTRTIPGQITAHWPAQSETPWGWLIGVETNTLGD